MSYTFKTPFSSTGERTVVPEQKQASGNLSMAEGFGTDYERNPVDDSKSKHIERKHTNYLFYIITEALKEIQENGVFLWSESRVPYSKGTIVKHSGYQYISQTDNNQSKPGITADWKVVITDISEALKNLNVYSVEEIDTKLQSIWNSLNDKDGRTVGDIYFKSSTTLTTGEAVCNGDTFSVTSEVGQAIMSLDKTFRDSWGIKNDGKNVNLPNLLVKGMDNMLVFSKEISIEQTAEVPFVNNVSSSDSTVKLTVSKGKIDKVNKVYMIPVIFMGRNVSFS